MVPVIKTQVSLGSFFFFAVQSLVFYIRQIIIDGLQPSDLHEKIVKIYTDFNNKM